jgi:cytidylate kinase
MSIITISRGAFSGGEALADQVASALDYRCVSREVLVEASRRYGIPEAKFTEILETGPRWWERWVESLRLYRIVLQAAMCEVAQGGNLVYHGHGGHELFPGIRHVLRVHLTSPMEYRIQQVRSRNALDETAARQYIDQVDKARTRRLHAVFGTDWRDPVRYDLVLNLGQMTLETAAHLIVEGVRREEYQPTAASEQAFQDLTVTARVQAVLIMSPITRSLSLSVQAERGVVRVSGMLSHMELEADIIRLIEAVPGVTQVIADFKWLPIVEDMYR